MDIFLGRLANPAARVVGILAALVPGLCSGTALSYIGYGVPARLCHSGGQPRSQKDWLRRNSGALSLVVKSETFRRFNKKIYRLIRISDTTF